MLYVLSINQKNTGLKPETCIQTSTKSSDMAPASCCRALVSHWVFERYSKLNLAPYGGFINPVYTPVIENGKIKDIKIEYPDDYVKQMLRYSKDYSFL